MPKLIFPHTIEILESLLLPAHEWRENQEILILWHIPCIHTPTQRIFVNPQLTLHRIDKLDYIYLCGIVWCLDVYRWWCMIQASGSIIAYVLWWNTGNSVLLKCAIFFGGVYCTIIDHKRPFIWNFGSFDQTLSPLHVQALLRLLIVILTHSAIQSPTR